MIESSQRSMFAPRKFREKLLMGMTLREYLRSLVTPLNFVAGAILVIGIPTIVYRFVFGLGAVTNLSQTNPWGLWIGFDVLAGVALAAGGYVLACAVYLFGLREYHPVVRPAILTGFLGYFFVVVGLLMDLGQPWRVVYPVFYSYGLTSVMFEVAWCVFLYLMVLSLEFSPALFEWLGWTKARQWVSRITIGLVVFGVVLSTLHQSSLGALFLMAPTKLHPLWYSPFLPVFFFVSSIAAGLAMVIVETSISHRAFRDQLLGHKHVDLDRITFGLGKAASAVLFSYFFMKLIGVADGESWGLLWTPYGYWFLIEMIGFVLLPCFIFAHGVRERSTRLIRAAAGLTVVGIVVNRLNVALIALNWNAAERYVPSWMEVLVTVTIVTLGLLTFRWIVNRMPILQEHPEFKGTH